MGQIWNYIITAAISLAVGVAVPLIVLRLKPRARIVWYSSPEPFIFRNSEDDKAIYIQIIYLKNNGKDIASGLEIIHTRKPDIFSIVPSRKHETTANLDGGHVIIINSLAPNECLTIQLLGYMEPPSLPVIRSNAGQATQKMRLTF